MKQSLSGSAEPLRLVSGVPLDVAAHRGGLVGVDGVSPQHGLQGRPQVPAVHGLIVTRSAAVELAAIAEGLEAAGLWREQIELGRAGGSEVAGQALLLVQ